MDCHHMLLDKSFGSQASNDVTTQGGQRRPLSATIATS